MIFILLLYAEPAMGDLNKIVVPHIEAYWDDVAYALHFGIPYVEGVKVKFSDPKKCCQELLKDWLSTSNGVGPKTYSTLLDKLKEVEELIAVTNDIMQKLAVKLQP